MNVVKKLFTDGRSEDVAEKMSLTQMHAFVGGYIEMVKSNIPRRALVVNENGFNDNLPQNPNATTLVYPGTSLIDGYIRGNALLVKS